MNALQVHYTSCRYGMLGDSGFQVRSASDGIQPDELREISSRSLYQPPFAEPEEDTTAATPIAFRYYRLSSGRVGLTKIAYTGRDYSGREGNFFAHTLVLPSTAVTRWPTEYFSWQGWKLGMEVTEDQSPPVPLPALPITELERAPGISTKELATFLRQGAHRERRLEGMVHALFFAGASSRSVVVRSTPDNAFPWLAALLRCIPQSIAAATEISSYEFSPQRVPTVAATVENTEFILDATQRDYQFYVFDEVRGGDSRVPDTPEELVEASAAYAALVVRLLAHAPDRLDDFLGFAADLGANAMDLALSRTAQLYALNEQGESTTIHPEMVRTLTEFVLQRPGISQWERTTHLLEQPLSALANNGTISDRALQIRFMLAAAKEGDMTEQVNQAVTAWVELWLSEVSAGHAPGEASGPLKTILEQVVDGGAATLAAALLDHTSHLNQLLGDAPVMVARAVITELIVALEITGRVPALGQPELLSALNAASSNEERICALLPELLPQAEDGTTFLALYRASIPNTGREKDDELYGDFLVCALEDAGPEIAREVRQADLTLAVLEWKTRTRKSNDPVGEFLRYRSLVDEQLCGMEWSLFALLVMQLATQSDDTACLELARDLIQRDELDILFKDAPAATTRCIEVMNRAAPIDPEEALDEAVASRLPEIAVQCCVELHPNRVAIRRVLEAATSNDTRTFPISSVEKTAGELTVLEDDEYGFVIETLLRAADPTLTRFSPDDHRRLITAIGIPDSLTFERRYLSWLKKAVFALPDKELAKLLHMWAALEPESEKNRDVLDALSRKMKKQIHIGLARRDHPQGLRAASPGPENPLNIDQRRRLDGLLEEVNKTRNSLLGKVAIFLDGVPSPAEVVKQRFRRR